MILVIYALSPGWGWGGGGRAGKKEIEWVDEWS